MQKLIHKVGYRKLKYGLIALVVILSIIFAISLVLAIKGYIDFQTINTLTM
ncbi:hypothetical protein [Latilactobacillus sakei]|uniref:Uncharacterized protein n=1 Tax=Latilactobacillus sakei TaxID=1599 RepID=A0AAF0GPP5_LATSK|nr:hypothetical protein [Latilactobacillus sakei]WGI18846.1 hypothetical protein QBD03_08835 [Latilactobacillus sakei]SPS03256.1 hypothetical protein LAS9624_00062 [Latilactobacillus sakei]